MKISFIGMSGCGKTTISKKYEEHGYSYFGCDDRIENKLKTELGESGFSGIHDVAKWLGHPYEPKHRSSSLKYLQFEKQSMQEIIDTVENFKGNAVIDTTGSVIYTGQEIMERLSNVTRIIYIKVPETKKKHMFQVYLNDPKPVIWGNSFNKKKGESDMEAMQRCYLDLMEYRINQYEKCADFTVDYSDIEDNIKRILNFENSSYEIL